MPRPYSGWSNPPICRGCLKLPNKHSPFGDLRTDVSRRRRIIKECGHRCQMCGCTEWNGKPIPLQLDHIDGSFANNARENLRVLCLNCHTQTPTFGGRNKKFPGRDLRGRPARYTRT